MHINTDGPGSERPIPPQLTERFSIQSQIAMAVYPKLEKPYLFGLHQCAYPRTWTAEEERLFEEIGRRLADAVTSLLMFHTLRDSEAKLEKAQRLAHVGHWDLDLETNLRTWSAETRRIFGLPPEEPIRSFDQILERVHPDDRQRASEGRTEALQGGARYFEMEYRVIRPSGEVRIVHSQGEITRDPSGRPRRVFGMLQDITERKRAEEALQQAQAELAHVVRLTTVGELAASIAHELNQPLGAIVNNAHACRRLGAAVPGLSNQVDEALSDIINDANRASAIVARVRALIKKTPLEKAPLDLGEVLAEVLALAQRELAERRIRVVTKMAQGPPRVWGDRVQLQQVFLNLVINALEAMSTVPEERRVLTLETQRDQLDGEPVALVRVQDRGAGFGPGQAERLFEAFYTTKAQGLGMGLRISRSIVEAHGGRLWASANADWGATFLCALPAGGPSEP